MAENYIARAKVKVEPDLKGFAKAVRDGVTAATAKPVPIKIVPITKGFHAAIQKSVRTAKPIVVPILPAKLREFRASITRDIVPAKVPILPDPTGFRAALIAEVATASAGVAATVPVVATGGIGEVSALETAIAGLTGELQRLNVVQTQTSKGGKAREKTETSLTQVENLRQKITTNLARAEIALADAQNASLSTQERSTAATTASTKVKTAYAAAVDLSTASTLAEDKAQLDAVRAMQARLATESGTIDLLKIRAKQEKAIAPIIETKNQLEQQATAILRVELKAITDSNIASEQRAAASKLLTSLKSLEARANKANAEAIVAEIAATRAQVTEYVSFAKVREKGIRDEAKALERLKRQQIEQGKTAAGQLRFARRGAAATALSLLGIRGATLASTGAFLAGAAAASVFALSVKSAADLQQELNVFRETAGATAEQMERVRTVAEELGRDIRLPGISAADAAQSMTGLARAGLSVEDAIAGATGVLQLAIAANIDMARSTEIVASALNAFGLAGTEAISVADTLANAANLAQGSIDDMGIAMQQASAVGRQAGLDFQDTATFLTILAKAGLRGSDAGTSLRTGLIRLINPTEKAQKILDKLGVSIRDAEGNIRPEVFQNLAVATADMTKAQRDQTIAQLAGNDAVRAFSIAMRVSLPQFLKYRSALREAGSAARLTAARAEGLAGATRGLASNFQTVGISIGRSATPPLQGFVEGMNTALLAISQSDTVSKTLTDTFTSLGNALSGIKATFEALLPALGLAVQGLFAITQAIGIGPILAGVAAFKLFKPVVGALAVTFGFLQSKVLLATSTFGAFRNLGLTRTMATAATFRDIISSSARSLNLWAIGITAAAVGLTYLISRESAAEKAAKDLSQATDGLAQAMERQEAAARGVRSAERGATLARRALDAAKAAASQARLNILTTNAASNSKQYGQLLNALDIALQDVTFAQQDYDEALKGEGAAREENQAAIQDDIDRRNELARAVQNNIDVLKEAFAARSLSTSGEDTAAFRVAQEIAIREDLIDVIEKEASKVKDSTDVAEREIGRRLEVLARLIRVTEQVPDFVAISVFLTEPDLDKALRNIAPRFGVEGQKDVEAWAEGFAAGLPGQMPKLNKALSREFESMQRMAAEAAVPIGARIGNSIADGLRAAKANIVAALNEVLDALEAQAKRFAEKEDILTIMMGGRPTAQQRLALAVDERENLEKQLAATIVKGKALGWPKELVEERRRLHDELANANEKVADIEDEIKSDTEAAAAESEQKADDAASALERAGQAFVEQLARRAQKLLNRQERAGLTEWLTDDIRTARALRRLYKRQIDLIKQNVKDKETRNEAIRALQRERFQLDLDLAQLLKQQAERRNERLREVFELDIEFFSTRENVRGEINARRRFIAYLKRLQAETKKGTLEYKRLRNEIAQQEAAIRELRNQTKDRNNAFRELTFEFMQAQQGFASNLLGNLIPIGASHDLVNIASTGGGGGALGGSGSLPTAALPAGILRGDRGGPPLQPDNALLQAQARAAGATQPPMGRDQASVEIELLRTIAEILARMERGARHPEARKSQISQSASFETMPHGASYVP